MPAPFSHGAAMLSDLEMVRLCAEAMGLSLCEQHSHYWPRYFDASLGEWGTDICYDPLHDDAQAMALVKKFRLEIEDEWLVSTSIATSNTEFWSAHGKDLNRAIVECVAKMELAKRGR